MIRKAQPRDKKAIYDLHSAKVNLNKYDEMEYYFSQLFDTDGVVVNEINGHVAASIQANQHVMMLNGVRVAVGALLAPIGSRQEPRYLTDLLRDVLDEQSRKYLVTLFISDQLDQARKYDFEPVYRRRIFTIRQEDMKNRSYHGVGRSFKIPELNRLYGEYCSYFNGYYLRDTDYWITRFQQMQFQRYNIAVYRDTSGELKGYMIYQISQSKVYVDELVYLNGEALIRLLCYAMRYKTKVEVAVGQNEDLSRIFPKVKSVSRCRLAVRINDLALFNRLYDSSVTSTEQAFALAGRPLFLNEAA